MGVNPDFAKNLRVARCSILSCSVAKLAKKTSKKKQKNSMVEFVAHLFPMELRRATAEAHFQRSPNRVKSMQKLLTLPKREDN